MLGVYCALPYGYAKTDFYTFENETSFYFVNNFSDGWPEHFGLLRNVITTHLEITFYSYRNIVTTIHHTTLSMTISLL